HMAFRLLLDDRDMYDGPNHGIYFLRSFTDNMLVTLGSDLVETFHFSPARFLQNSSGTSFTIGQQQHFLHYELDTGKPETGLESLHEKIAPVDRAYTVRNGITRMIRIAREQWPLLPVVTKNFETDFFTSARLEG